MARIINAKQLRSSLPDVVRRARRGERFVVLYRSRPAFQVVPVDPQEAGSPTPIDEDSLFGAKAVGRSRDGKTSRDHDRDLYGSRR